MALTSVYRNPFWHSVEDTLEHVDLEMVADAARVTLLLMGWWDSGPGKAGL